MTSTAPRRLLVVCMDNLGDLVFTTAIFGALRAAFPDAEIAAWVKAYTADVAKLIAGVNRVIAADPPWAVHPQRAKPSTGAFLSSIGEVRSGAFDVAILTNAPWRLALAVRASGIPIRIGAERHRNRPFLTHVLPPDDAGAPVVSDMNRLLAPMGVPPVSTRYVLDATRLGQLRGKVASRLPDKFIAFHPFAAVPEKRVPIDEWITVARSLDERGWPVLWCGVAAELSELRRLNHPPASYVDELGEPSLAVTAAALSLARGFVGHDSGPLHVAGAFGVPVVDVFVGGNPARYGPQGTGPSRVIIASEPGEITAPMMLAALDEVFSAP